MIASTQSSRPESNAVLPAIRSPKHQRNSRCLLRINTSQGVCLKTSRVTSQRLRHLASLLTRASESAGLCALPLGLYRLPATAHQWSGLVARSVLARCMSAIQSGHSIPVLDGGCAQGALGRAGFANSTGRLTCVQPPPSFSRERLWPQLWN